GFAKIKISLEFEVLRKLIANIKTNLLKKLLDTPDGIDKQLKDALPFSLSLEDPDLNEAPKNIFPITTQDELKKLGQHKRSLQ
ncbi:5022_t:CDS:2, partial [Gigaspora rosea]